MRGTRRAILGAILALFASAVIGAEPKADKPEAVKYTVGGAPFDPKVHQGEESKTASAWIEQMFKAQNIQNRYRAVEALVKILDYSQSQPGDENRRKREVPERPQIRKAMLKLIEDKKAERELRGIALRCYCGDVTREDEQELLSLLQKSDAMDARGAAAAALGQLLDKGDTAALRTALKRKGQGREVVNRIIVALGELGGPDSRRELIELKKKTKKGDGLTEIIDAAIDKIDGNE